MKRGARISPDPTAPPLELSYRRVATQFVQHVMFGRAREVALFGPRGEGKSWSAFGAMLAHAEVHAQRGFPLPVPWISVMDYFSSHESKTHETLRRPEWRGAWSLEDDGHIARGWSRGINLVKVRLMGIEDKGALDRVRLETVGVHFEEVAPAGVLVHSAGISEDAWNLAITSQRVPTHAHVAMLSTNYPDEEHWSWQRFVVRQHPGTAYFRIPPGERTTEKDRAEWARALEGRPDMLRRLLAGEPGGIQLGDPVTPEYQEPRHFSPTPLRVAEGSLWFAWDFYHRPACAAASMTSLGQLRVHFACRMDNADIGALVEERVKPWLSSQGLLERPRIHTGDPTGMTGDQSDRSRSAVRRLLELLPGEWRKVSNVPEEREDAVKQALRRSLSTGEPAVILGPDARELHKALRGGWHRGPSAKVVKHGPEGLDSHVADAAAYLCLAVFGSAVARIDWSKWANQAAYRQPWGGAPVGESSPSPASGVLRGPHRFDPEKWRKQYER